MTKVAKLIALRTGQQTGWHEGLPDAQAVADRVNDLLERGFDQRRVLHSEESDLVRPGKRKRSCHRRQRQFRRRRLHFLTANEIRRRCLRNASVGQKDWAHLLKIALANRPNPRPKRQVRSRKRRSTNCSPWLARSRPRCSPYAHAAIDSAYGWADSERDVILAAASPSR